MQPNTTEMKNEQPNIYYHLGLSYANLELFEYAIEPLTQAIEISTLEPAYYHERAKCYLLTSKLLFLYCY